MRSSPLRRCFVFLIVLFTSAAGSLHGVETKPAHGRFLYVAVPGIRNYLEYGGHGVLVYDIDEGHRLVRRIASGGLAADGKPSNVKGICASAATGRLYVSTIKSLQCYDLLTDKILWEKVYEAGCDRMSITHDGKTMYLPSCVKDHWLVVDALNGDVVRKITLNSRSRNTVISPDGQEAYLAGLASPLLAVADATTNDLKGAVGPFSGAVRPFTVNGSQTKVYANLNNLLGFEVGDLKTGKVLQ